MKWHSLIVILAIALPAFGQRDYRLDVMGSWGVGAQAVEFEVRDGRQLAYLARGQRLQILDATDPGALVELGAIDLVAQILDVAVEGGYAYCATVDKPYRFCVVDVSDPARPELAFAWQPRAYTGGQVWPTSPRRVELWSGYAFVDHFLFDVRNPARPENLGHVDVSGRVDMKIVGDLIFAASSARTRGFSIYRLGDPREPELLSSLTFDGSLHAMVVDGDLACLLVSPSTGDPEYLQVVDVSNPASPRLRGRFDDDRISRGGSMALSEGVLALSGSPLSTPRLGGAPSGWELWTGMRIIDIGSDPDAPVVVGHYKPRTGCSPRRIHDGIAWLASPQGVTLLNVRDPAQPVVVSHLYSAAPRKGLAARGDDLFGSDPHVGVTWLDWSDDFNPRPLAVFTTPGFDGTPETGGLQDHGGIHLADGQLAFAAGLNGLYVFDAQDPAEFNTLASRPFPEGIQSVGVEREGRRLHVGTQNRGGGGWLVEFSFDPVTGQIPDHGSIDLGSPPSVLRSDGAGHTFAVTSSEAGYIFDTRDPEAPRVLSQFPGGNDLVLDGSLMWIARSLPSAGVGSGLYCYDVSDPSNPVVLSHTPIVRCQGLAFDDAGRLYTMGITAPGIPGSTHARSLSVFDVSDPARPRLLAQGRTAQGTLLEYANGRIYESSGHIKAWRLRCLADTDGDGELTINDFHRFLHAFSIGDSMIADCDFDGLFTFFDFLCFQEAWARGCP